MNNLFSKVYFTLLVLLSSSAVNAQFSRYWSESFSTKSALLSGAVVGGYQDESSIYYNPSILSDSSVNQFSFANGLAKVDYIQYENAMGSDLDISNWESSVDPGFISLNLYPKGKYDLVWKAAFFNRSKFDNSFEEEVKFTEDVFTQVPGNEQYIGKIRTRTEYNDYWYGLGIAKFINDDLSIGISAFARYTSLRYNYEKITEIGTTSSDSALQKVAINANQLNTRGFTWRGTFKIGLNYRVNDKLRAGLTITTPSFSIFGNAAGTVNVSKVNIPNGVDGGLLPDYFYDGSSSDMNMKIRDPLSIALGLDYKLPNLRWNLTMEWFGGLKPYKMIDQEEGAVNFIKTTVVPDNGSDVLSYAAGGKSLVNIALGLEIYNENNRSILVGFKTDFDALNGFDYEDLSHLSTLENTASNFYHFSAGKSFSFLKYDVLFGLQYSISRQKNLPAFANFSSPVTLNTSNPYDLEGPIQNNMKFKGDVLILFVGLTLKN
ncbi:MAG: hypothetical protein ACJA2N_000235 [Salibacteraceae bacterium]|jgi:hypothetical protein